MHIPLPFIWKNQQDKKYKSKAEGNFLRITPCLGVGRSLFLCYVMNSCRHNLTLLISIFVVLHIPFLTCQIIFLLTIQYNGDTILMDSLSRQRDRLFVRSFVAPQQNIYAINGLCTVMLLQAYTAFFV